MKHFFRVLFICGILIFASFAASAASISEKLEFKSFEIIRIDTVGRDSAKAVVSLTMNNKWKQFEVSTMNISLSVDGEKCVSLSKESNEIVVFTKGEHTNHFMANVKLESRTSLYLLLGMLKTYDRPEVVVEIEMRPALRGGLGIPIKVAKNLDNVDAAEYLKQNIAGKSIDTTMCWKNYRNINAHIAGSIPSLDVYDISVDSVSRSLVATVILGVNCSDLSVIGDKLKVTEIVFPPIKLNFFLNDTKIASVESMESQIFENNEKTKNKKYLFTIKGGFDDSYNPCMLLSFLMSEKDRPEFSFKVDLDWRDVDIDFARKK